MIKEAIKKVAFREDLTQEEMGEAMREMTTGKASSEQIASFVTALRMKGETPEEITAAAKVLRERATRIHVEGEVVCLDREEITVERETILSTTKSLAEGTSTFNVSTATALIVAGGGLKVVKYGRKSLPPLCGSADVVQALGINLGLAPTQLERCVKEVGICFLYDPLVQNGLEDIITVRKKVGLRTIFNLLDPLINPARARFQVLGVYDPSLTETMAAVLRNLGVERGLVVHGEKTLDEMSIVGKTRITRFDATGTQTFAVQPEDFGMTRGELSEIEGGTPQQNAQVIREILEGRPGATRDISILNAAAAFVVAGVAGDFTKSIDLACQAIDSGEALSRLEELIKFTNAEESYLRKAYEL